LIIEKDISSNYLEIRETIGIGLANLSKASKTKKRF
tara:strand:- start:440 stop:547 length:108 start_codon:yes stop_codon:yes gene_type:complete